MMSLCLSSIPKKLFLSVCERGREGGREERGREGERRGKRGERERGGKRRREGEGRRKEERGRGEGERVLLGSLSEDIIFSVIWTG